MIGHWCKDGEHVEGYSWPLYDGYGIYLTRVCEKCEKEKTKKYRSDIFEQYETDETIEPQ